MAASVDLWTSRVVKHVREREIRMAAWIETVYQMICFFFSMMREEEEDAGIRPRRIRPSCAIVDAEKVETSLSSSETAC